MRRFKKYIAELHRVFRREPLRFFSAKLNLLRAPLRYVLFITALLFFSPLFWSGGNAHAQYRKLDSLKTALQNHSTQDLKHLQLLQQIAEAQEWSIPKDGITTADKAIALAKKLNNQKELAIAYNMKARLMLYDYTFEEAEKIIDSAIAINTSIKNQLAVADNFLAKAIQYNYMNEPERNKGCLDTASLLVKPFNDIKLKGRIQYNYGLYYNFFNADSSNIHYNNAIKLFEQLADSIWLATNYTWLARNLINVEKPDSALIKTQVDKVRSLLMPGGCNDYYALELVFIAQTMATHSMFTQAIKYLYEALPLAEKANNKLYISYVYFNLALSFQNLANYPLSLSYYHKALKIYENLHDDIGAQATLTNIGVIHKELKDYNLALKYIQRSYEMSLKIKSKYNQVGSLEEIGDVYFRQNKLIEALEVFQNSLKISIEIKADDHIAICYGYLGDVYVKLNKYDSAFYYFNNAAMLNKKMGITAYYAKNLVSVSRAIKDLPDNEITDLMLKFFNPDQKYKKAIEYATEALTIVKETGELDIQRDACLLLSQLYEKENNTAATFKYYRHYVMFNDSLMNKEKTKSIANLQLQYDSEKQQQQIASLTKDKQLKQAEVAKQKTQRNILMTACALVLVLIGFIVNRYMEKTKATKEIEKTYNHLLQTQQQLVQQGKLVALAKMTADVAQQIKEPISQIKNLSPQGEQLVKQYENTNNEEEKASILQQLKTYLTEINSNGIAANDVVKDVLQQTRKQTA